MAVQELELPIGIEVYAGPAGLRFRGVATALIELSARLRRLSHSPIDTRLAVDGWERNVAASKFTEVATGRERSPFDFGQCGYLSPRPDPDIGVDLVGAPEND